MTMYWKLAGICRCVHCNNFTHGPFPNIFFWRYTLADHLHLTHYLTKPPESNWTWMLIGPTQKRIDISSIEWNKRHYSRKLNMISKSFHSFLLRQSTVFCFRMQTVPKTTQVVCTVLLNRSQKDLIMNNNSSPRDQRFCTKWWTHL